MTAKSAGILAFRRTKGQLEVLLVHPGGPFWRNRDLGAWSIPKGEYGPGEDAEAVARREFREELGIDMSAALVALGEIKQKGGKIVTAFAVETDIDTSHIQSNTCEIEWPPRSGRKQTVPEVDRAEWFDLAAAKAKINAAQSVFLDRLTALGDAATRPRD